MKKIIFFVAFVSCFASFVHAQPSHSVGLSTSYFSHLITHSSRVRNKTIWKEFYKTPQLNVVYNHFFNKKHGIVAGLGVIRRKREFSEQSVFPNLSINKNYHASSSLHYIFKYEQFFVKSGFNIQTFNIYNVREDIISFDIQGNNTTTTRITSTNIEQLELIPEFHFALGRDFDLGKINIRVNGFVERAFSKDDYIDAGFSTGIFYQFGK